MATAKRQVGRRSQSWRQVATIPTGTSAPEQREGLDRRLLGFVVWSEVVARFDLPSAVLNETRDPEP